MTPKEILRTLAADGWEVIRIKGSHHFLKHPSKPGTTVVAMHRADVKIGTLKAIEKQTGVRLR